MKVSWGRIVLSVLCMMGFGFANLALRSTSAIVGGNLTVNQLENSNANYIASSATGTFFNGTPLGFGIIFIILLLIWIKPIIAMAKKAINGDAPEANVATGTGTDTKGPGAGTAMAVILALVFVATNSFAYYDKADNPEYIEIGSNQSVFVIPMAGANKDSQGQFDSASFLNSKKVGTKRIEVKHTKMHFPGLTVTDMFIPTVKVIITDRIPYNREWAKD